MLETKKKLMLIEAKKKILSIEAIRGFAAIYVMLGHIVLLFQPYVFFPEYKFICKTIFGYGHQAVLLFFIVSGFSITYSSSNINIYDKYKIKEYLFKRFRRIYPLFFIALLISLSILPISGAQSDIKRDILSFFFITDTAPGSIVDPIPTNFPIWSLSYEVVYYLLFPLLVLAWQKKGRVNTFLIVLFTGVVTGLVGFLGWPNHIFNVLQYYWIWIAGAMLAEAYINRRRFHFKYLYGLLVSSLAFMLTIEKIPIVSDWCWSLFFLILFVSFFVDERLVKAKERLINIIIGFASLGICYSFTNFSEIVYHKELIKSIIIAIAGISLILYFLPTYISKKLVRFLMKPFVMTGSFSYSLYIIHWPIIMFSVFIHKKFLGGTMLEMGLMISATITIVFLLSWFLEEMIQPKIAKTMNRLFYKDQQPMTNIQILKP